MKRLALVLAGCVAGAMLAGCEKQIPAPDATGVCWHGIPLKDATIKWNQVAAKVDSIEKCAAELEGMRMRFLRMGGAQEIMGAYQGQYMWLLQEGIFVSKTQKGARYVLLVRTGDGRLAVPGVMPQE